MSDGFSEEEEIALCELVEGIRGIPIMMEVLKTTIRILKGGGGGDRKGNS